MLCNRKPFLVVGSMFLFCLGSVFIGNKYMTKDNKLGMVIILNGPSAVGKSSIIRAFQAKRAEPWLGIGIDNFFIGVLPPKFYLEDKPEHREVMYGIATEDEQGKLFTLHIGLQGQKVIKGMHQAIAAYARAGNNVIVDYIMYNPQWHHDLMSTLSGLNVIAVGVTASLSAIEERERVRATSPQGHARSVYQAIHEGWNYQLTLDTDNLTPDQSADMIISYMVSKKLTEV